MLMGMSKRKFLKLFNKLSPEEQKAYYNYLLKLLEHQNQEVLPNE